jgi:hypothetical protein
MKAYAGVGSRETPDDMLALCQMAAEALADQNYVLRTGHAPGADQAFERGAGRLAEVFLPWPSFENSEPLEADVIHDGPTVDAMRIAARLHPNWANLKQGAQKLHARNVHQVLGADTKSPSVFVLCWHQGSGGTMQAVRIAEAHNVPVFNLADGEVRWRIERMIEFQRAMEL